MAKTHAFALHSILSTVDGKETEYKPGTVFEVDQDEFDRLERNSAVRVPTKDEITLSDAKARQAAGNATSKDLQIIDDNDDGSDEGDVNDGVDSQTGAVTSPSTVATRQTRTSRTSRTSSKDEEV